MKEKTPSSAPISYGPPMETPTPPPTQEMLAKFGPLAFAEISADQMDRTIKITVDDPFPDKTKIEVTLDTALAASQLLKGLAGYLLGKTSHIKFFDGEEYDARGEETDR